MLLHAALKFELELQELQGGGAPIAARVTKCFQVFGKYVIYDTFQRCSSPNDWHIHVCRV